MEGNKKHGEGNAGKVSWIEWYCSQPENIFFCKVNKTFIKDNFNLYDLKTLFTTESIYKEALTMILDEASLRRRENQDSYAQHLYGLIHARYIKSAAGLEAMRRKYVRGDFGTCPRHGCSDQLVLPIGMTDTAGEESVKIFCTKCQNVYSCSHPTVDAAYFGRTFPHLFYMTYDQLVGEPLGPDDTYVPTVFGFRVHASSSSLPSAKYYAREDSSASSAQMASGNGFNISNIQQHNPVSQHVPAANAENRKKRCLGDSDDSDNRDATGIVDSSQVVEGSGEEEGDIQTRKRAKHDVFSVAES